jgi:dTDP-4-amino-4,6-dideoxygalactose transaminase
MGRPAISGPPALEGGRPLRSKFLPFARPDLGKEERAEVLAALDSGWITTGPRVEELETALVAATGSPHVVCLSSCTAALHLALHALGLRPGDEVITTALTFCGTVNAILHAGGTPVLVDVEEDTLNLDPVRVQEAVTSRTRAILPVHYGGHPAEMDPILDLAREKGLAVVEDAAHAAGALYRERPAGTMGWAGCFSFYATKNLTTGEGGALLTADEDLARRARVLSLHGMNRDAWRRYTATGSWFYEVEAAGFKYNLSDLHAALGIHQLRRLPSMNERRRRLATLYDEAFADLSSVRLPVARDHVVSARHLYPIRLELEGLRVDRARFLEALGAENIGASVHFIPIHFHPFYREHLGKGPGSFPVTEDAYSRLVSLPLYSAMAEEDAHDVVAAVRKLVTAYAV